MKKILILSSILTLVFISAYLLMFKHELVITTAKKLVPEKVKILLKSPGKVEIKSKDLED